MKNNIFPFVLIILLFTASIAVCSITRAISLGGGFTAIPGDIASVEWNPAGLVDLTGTYFSIFSMGSDVPVNELQTFVTNASSMTFNRKLEPSYKNNLIFCFAEPLSDRLVYGFEFNNFTLDSKEYTFTGPSYVNGKNVFWLSEPASQNSLIFLATAYKINETLSLGGKLKVYDDEEFSENPALLNLNSISFMYRAGKHLSFGGIIDGNLYSISNGTKIGVSCNFPGNKLLAAGSLGFNAVDAGIEWKIFKHVYLRSSYSDYRSLSPLMKSLRSRCFNAGMGFVSNGFSIDYCYSAKPLYYREENIFIFPRDYTLHSGTKHEQNLSVSYRFKDNLIIKKQWLARENTKEQLFDINVSAVRELPLAVYHLFETKNIFAVSIKIRNISNKKATAYLSCAIGTKNPEYSSQAELEPLSEKTFNINPIFSNDEIAKINTIPTFDYITVQVKQSSAGEPPKTVFSQSCRVALMPYDQFMPSFIDAQKKTFNLTDTIVNWVTYNDRLLSGVLSKAGENGKKLTPPVKLIGFQQPRAFSRMPEDKRSAEQKGQDYIRQVKLIYNTLCGDYRLVYMNQPVIFGSSQRIKFPMDTLQNKGNCIELSVLAATLLESIEIDPLLFIFPEDKHASVGWRVQDRNNEKLILLETNLFGENFEKVLAGGEKLVEQYGLNSAMQYDDNGVYDKSPKFIIYDVRRLRKHIPPSPFIK